MMIDPNESRWSVPKIKKRLTQRSQRVKPEMAACCTLELPPVLQLLGLKAR
jgi:hypothetical protein